jgi:hypothetical protein
VNATVAVGVAIIFLAVFVGVPSLLVGLGVGLAVIAFGAFGPSPKRPAEPRPVDDERFV